MDLEITNEITNKNINTTDFSKQLELSLSQKNHFISIDRFEGEFAICENKETGEFFNIPKCELPVNVKEGSILKFENGKYILDNEKTNQEQEEIKNMVNNLFKK